ncbi:MAG: 4Fe-4S binding protein [Bacteroidales bacterium]|nr:4Fe-4S binding protein [Bacteroidales bacterium]
MTLVSTISEIIDKVINNDFSFKWKQHLLFESVNKPTCFISVTSACPVHTILGIKSEIQRYANERHIEIEVYETGSIGILSFEPVLAIQLPGKARLFYAEINAEDIFALLEAVFSSWVQHVHLIGQLVFEGSEPWAGVQVLSEKSWFCFPTRFITEACGFVLPDSLRSALACNRWTTFLTSLRNMSPGDIVLTIIESELKGRSGSGFNTGKKWKLASERKTEQCYLICNAFESNPASAIGRLLLESDPHLVLESIAISAYANQCNKAYLVVPYYYSLAIKRIQKALDDAYENGLLGFDIQKSGFSLDIILFVAPGSYIMGEETAIIQAIEGKKAMPIEKPPYPIQKGLFGKPTIINNIETLCHVTYIVRYGVQWFKSYGNSHGYGTKLFSVSGANVLRGVFELPLGTSMKDIYELTKWSDNDSVKAIHIGGPIGRIFSHTSLNEMNCNYADSMQNSFLGDGTILFLDNSNCMVDYVKNEIQFICSESCGKCLPCREGSKKIEDILNLLTHRPENEKNKETLERIKQVMQLNELATTIAETSLCGLGKHFPLLVSDLIQHFKEELEEHLYERHCRAGVCKNLRRYYINVEKCIGCHVCFNRCPQNAIVGVIQHPHFIIQEKCNSCGICYGACKFSAIEIK